MPGWLRLVAVAWRRLADDRLIVGATALTIVVGLIQLAAAPMYTDAVTVGALRWTAASAPPEVRTVGVEASTAPETVGVVDEAVVTAIARSLGDAAVSRRLFSPSFELPAPPSGPGATADEAAADAAGAAELGPDGPGTDQPVELTVLASIEGLAGHASLVEGVWPDRSPSGGGQLDGGVVPAVLAEPAAERLGLRPGDVVDLSRRRDGAPLSAEIVGLYRVDDRNDRFWDGDELLTDGVRDGTTFRTIGPLVVERVVLVGGVAGRLDAGWLAEPELTTLDGDAADALARRIRALPERVEDAIDDLPETVTTRTAGLDVSSGLPALLDDAARSVSVSRSGILAVAAQLAILAGMALGIGAGLLVQARGEQTELLQARGSGRGHLIALAGVEAVLLIGPAAFVAPWLAAGLLRALDRRGPLAAVDFPIEPTIGGGSVAIVGVAAVVMAALLVAPVAATRSIDRAKRQDRQAGTQRAGVDVALVVLTAGVFWQLGRLGSGARSVLGDRFAIDPLLLIAPSLALLTGAVTTLRIVPVLARLAERVVGRGRSTVATLVGWQVARRPAEQTRSVFLLALALAIGGFAASYAETWRVSQGEQAARRVGADVRVDVDPRSDAELTALHLLPAHAGLDGVIAALPLSRARGPFPAVDGAATIVALDARSAGDVITSPPADPDLTEAVAALAAARPSPGGVLLPGRPNRFELAVRIDEDRVPVPVPAGPDGAEPGTETGDDGDPPADDASGSESESGPDDDGQDGERAPELLPVAFVGWIDAVVQDGAGYLHRLELGRVSADEPTAELSRDLTLDRTDGGPGGDGNKNGNGNGNKNGNGNGPVEPIAPLTLVSFELRMLPPPDQSRPVAIELGPLTIVDGSGGRTAVDLGSGGDNDIGRWTVDVGGTVRLDRAASAVMAGPDGEGAVGVDLETGSSTSSSAVVTLDLRPDPVEAPARLPVVVTTAWLEASRRAIGDPLEVPSLPVPGGAAEIVGAIDGLPTVEPDDGLAIVDLPTLQLLAHRPGRPVEEVEEVWLAIADDTDSSAVVTSLTGPPFRSAAVIDRDGLALQLRTDPVALAAIGAYALAAGAAAVFAIVVFTTGAISSARRRRGEFQLLRALGLTPRQFGAWLAAEQLVLLVVAVALGTLIGLGLSAAILPRLALDQAGQPVLPPPRTVIPWLTVVAVQLVPAAAIAVIVTALSRRVRRRTMAGDLRDGAG